MPKMWRTTYESSLDRLNPQLNSAIELPVSTWADGASPKKATLSVAGLFHIRNETRYV